MERYGVEEAAKRGGADAAEAEAAAAGAAEGAEELSAILGALHKAASNVAVAPELVDEVELHHYDQLTKVQAMVRRRNVSRNVRPSEGVMNLVRFAEHPDA